ncbi:MAG: hypothetical protein J5934_08090 [Succinivibrio sp.]|nr:hypothetical protein [Succinivibrio sp.]
MIYFTSDLHLGHLNIIRYCSRPFELTQEGVAECDRFLIGNYCSVVKDDDFVFNLGDLAFFGGSEERKRYYQEVCRQLPGHKVMLRGNHDRQSDEYYLGCGFLDIQDYLVFEDFFICHYPLCHDEHEPENDPSRRLKEEFVRHSCHTLIHGHTHTRSPEDEFADRINVCVDNPATHYRPVTIDNLPVSLIEQYVNNLLTKAH